MFKKMMLLGLFVTIFAGSLFANGVDGENENSRKKETYDERFMIRLKSSKKYEAPLVEKVFPGVEFFIQRSSISKPNSIRLAGKYKDEFYPMPAQFNILYRLIEEKSKATIEERIEVFSRMLVVLPSTTKYLHEGKLEEIELIEISKDSTVINHIKFDYKVIMYFSDKIYKLLFWIQNNQIKWIYQYINGKKNTEIAPKTAYNCNRDINILIPDIIPEVFDDNENYYVAISNNNVDTDSLITFLINGLEPNHPNTRLQIKPIYGYNDSLFLNVLLDVDVTGNA